MNKIENALGKKIQITNSKIYSSLKNKVDYYFNNDYESILLSLSNLSFALGRYVGADIEKIKLYVAMLGIGKVDGGMATLGYINNQIIDVNKKISEFDVALYNLKQVFPNLETEFSKEIIEEFSQIYMDKCDNIEAKIIKTVYDLKLISQYNINNGTLNENQETPFVFNKIAKIIQQYNVSKELTLGLELNSILNSAKMQDIKLDDVSKDTLDLLVKNYSNGTIDKNNMIENLNKYRIPEEKKTKTR